MSEDEAKEPYESGGSVYLVMDADYHVEYVFSSEEDAEAYVKAQQATDDPFAGSLTIDRERLHGWPS